MATILWQLNHTTQNGCPACEAVAATLPLTPAFFLQQLCGIFFLPHNPLLSAGLCSVEGCELPAEALKKLCFSSNHLQCPWLRWEAVEHW